MEVGDIEGLRQFVVEVLVEVVPVECLLVVAQVEVFVRVRLHCVHCYKPRCPTMSVLVWASPTCLQSSEFVLKWVHLS